MSYHLESLGDERFQQLCQAILALSYPDIQCLPVGQPDGGRDAFGQVTEAGFVVYQVKFVRDPSSRDSRRAIEELVRSEKSKVERLIAKGATTYVLMTNVRGTSHMDVGSIDRVNKLLSDTFGIECRCFWRDDIERRLDGASAIKWSYPEILRATDLLENLVQQNQDGESQRRLTAIRSYVAYQAKQDSQLKFKQIDLHKTIVDLFVDVPSKVVAAPGMDDRKHLSKWRGFIETKGLKALGSEDRQSDRSEAVVGALELLIHPEFAKMAPRVVVEGAPGQGKSTVTQFMCQVHRLRLLNRELEYSKVPKNHRPDSLRIPFRIDLRDYATWLSGRNPFKEGSPEGLADGATPALESFIAAQVHASTGAAFSVSDFLSVSRNSQLLLVLDGFDEVADPKLRKLIVEQVTVAADRIAASAISSQLIVTSRPSAFANSPGFPRDEWQYVEILSLTREVIERYAERWLQGRSADLRERQSITRVLKEKLEQPHVRDLARNPMQLAILLTLISVQGASLPNKRTSLYDNYIEIFLNRESEKSEIVRNHRDLLVQIHRYLAWKLHSEAEQSGAGNVSEAELKESVREFLDEHDHPVELVDSLFTGMVERVVALVSRIQGTFEFEVQPLREYFAARHLYDTAPYAPPGKPRRKGTLPDRFDALAKNFYWLNVTRFYAGCYSSGELSSLVDGLADLRDSEHYKHLAYTPRLGLTLLADYVFNQQPRMASRLAEQVVGNKNIYCLLAEENIRHGYDLLRLPETSGREVVIDFAKSLIIGSAHDDARRAAYSILSRNCNSERRITIWRELRNHMTQDQWVDLGDHLGVASTLGRNEALALTRDIGLKAVNLLVHAGQYETLESAQVWKEYIVGMMDGNGFQLPREGDEDAPPCAKLTDKVRWLLWPFLIGEVLLDAPKVGTLRASVSKFFYSDPSTALLAEADHVFDDGDLQAISAAVDRIYSSDITDLLEQPELWSKFVETSRVAFGDRWGLYVASANFAEFCAPIEPNASTANTESVLYRATLAKQKVSDNDWWARELAEVAARGGIDLQFFCLCCLRWATPAVIVAVSEVLSGAIDGLTDREWTDLAIAVRLTPHRRAENKRKPAVSKKCLPASMSSRLATLLIPRISEASQTRLWERWLRSCGDSDMFVQETRASIAIREAEKGNVEWDEALEVIAEAYKAGAAYFGHLVSHGSGQGFPAEVAEKICSSPTAYPLSVVGVASNILSDNTGVAAVPLAEIATHDRWFDE